MNDQKAQAPQPDFIFRGNAIASGGYLTRLNGARVPLKPDTVTVHGESSLPTIGGISHSLIEKPKLPFPDWIQYGRCETFVEGSGDEGAKITTLRTSVEGVKVTTRPSPEDNVPNIRQITFQADRLSLEVRSVHPRQGQPYFILLRRPVTKGIQLVRTPKEGPAQTVKIELEYDHPLMSGYTLDELDARFAGEQAVFEELAARFEAVAAPNFGQKIPRSTTGYVVSSIVSGYRLDGKEQRGNVLVEPGFGRITFGQMIADGFSRRVGLVRIEMGSDPAGRTQLAGVDTNGVWN